MLLQNKYEDCPAIFRGESGTPMYPQDLQGWSTRFLKNNNLRHIGLHLLRHSYATISDYIRLI